MRRLEPIPRALLRRAALFRNPRGPAVARDPARHPYFLDYDYSVRDYQYTKPRNSAIFSPLDAMLVPRHPPVDASPRWRKKGI